MQLNDKLQFERPYTKIPVLSKQNGDSILLSVLNPADGSAQLRQLFHKVLVAALDEMDILHFLELDPTGKHIALGGDLDGITNMPRGFTGVQDYPKLANRLLERGLDEAMIRNIFWNNAIGVMDRAVCNHQK